MSRRRRDHEPGAFYFVDQGNRRHPLFSREDDYRIFERVLQSSLRHYGCRLHAFCLTTHTAIFVIQIGEVPLGRLMQRLNSLYVRQVHHGNGSSGRLFQKRYRAARINPNVLLADAVRFIHQMPEGDDWADYPHSSHRVYLGTRAAAWVTTSSTLRRLRNLYGRHAPYESRYAPYEAWMDNQIPPRWIERMNETSRTGSYVLDYIVKRVSSKLEVPSDLICSPTRSRKLTLARAVIAWHARKRGVASYTEIALRCHRHPSSISAAVERYRRAQPDLFDPARESHIFSDPVPTSPSAG